MPHKDRLSPAARRYPLSGTVPVGVVWDREMRMAFDRAKIISVSVIPAGMGEMTLSEVRK